MISSAQLLKLLEPAVRPSIAPPVSQKVQGSFESQSFDQLLAQAKKGSVHSGRQLEVACECQPPLEPSQLERMADAADQAQAAGAKRALLMVDGRGFVLDVASRSIVAEATADQAKSIQKTDAVVFVPADVQGLPGILKPPVAPNVPAAVVKQLQSLRPPLPMVNT